MLSWCGTCELLGLLDDLFVQFGNREGLTLDLVVSNGIDQIPAANEHSELTHVQLGDQNLFVASEDITQVAWEWIQVAKVGKSDSFAS